MFKLWLENIKSLERYSNKLIEDCSFSIRVILMIKVLNQISKENRLSEYDEKIFEYFHHLMWYYYQTISLYEQSTDHITNTRAKEILDGICSVLSAQLYQFQENQKYEYIYLDKTTNKNPIKLEKDEIINKTKKYVLSAMAEIENGYMEASGALCSEFLLTNYFNTPDKHLLYINTIKDISLSLINHSVDKLYKTYVDITKGSIEKINSLQFRKAANFYYESIKQEKDNLEIIIKVQVNALEDELKHMDIDVMQAQKIHEILDTLIEAYQHLGKEIEGLAHYFKESENKEVVLLTKEEFVDYLIKQGVNKHIDDLSAKPFPSVIEQINDEVIRINQKFEDEFNKTISELIHKNSVESNKNDANASLKDYITQKEMMVSAFVECFSHINAYYIQNESQLLETHFCDILKGIYETIDIKIENLKDSQAILIEELNSLDKNSLPINAISKEDVMIMIKEFLECYYNILPRNEEEFNSALEEFNRKISTHPILLKYHADIDKFRQQQADHMNKKYINFLRQQLLFELTTYEEILNYSVSRLRQEQQLDMVKGFVETIDRVNTRINELLIQYNIESIKPQPYDVFDGKEHEVLMAEKQEGFEKGQIIKLMNTGYKYNNTVVIRANVIAAK